jgi:spermidine synthase
MRLPPLFLVSLATVGIETALTRYFALASWSDYGYWVISIVMVGFALSGIVLSLGRDTLVKISDILLAFLPAALVISAALGYCATILNPFNPLQLQNDVTYLPQLGNIFLYYAALLPFFFLAGLFISLCFVLNSNRIGRVYAADLTGAGCGSILVLGLMYLCSPFGLIPALLPLLALAAFFAQRFRTSAVAAGAVALLAAELLLLLGPQPVISQYKPLYPPLHTPNAKIIAEIYSPRGDYLLLDDFTERVNTDISNDSGMMGYSDPPRSFGLYRDGIRIASLPRPGPASTGYAQGALDGLPYTLRPHPSVLIAGASGGFRIAEVFALGAARIEAAEPEPILYKALTSGLGVSPPIVGNPNLKIDALDPEAAMKPDQTFDIIDLSADFLDAASANVNSFTTEAFANDFNHLNHDGIISVPVSIQDFPVYALRMLATTRAALADAGVTDPAAHVIIYRSAWSARILISRTPFSTSDITITRKWCDDRSFDVSLYNGIDVPALRPNLYNDLPAVSFDAGTVTSDGPDDSIADEATQVLQGEPTISTRAFNLSPVTSDKPFFYTVLRLAKLGVLLARLQILPQSEIGALVNLAVLAQAVIIALLVLLVPLIAPRIADAQVRTTGTIRPILYFPALALGFLFIEIFAIEKASAFLADRATGFSLVLSFMLIFSGIGSLISLRFIDAAARGMWLAGLVIAAWSVLTITYLPSAMNATASLPFLIRCCLVIIAIAPVSLALGLPFPLGLAQISGGRFLPWAWGLNGAFSVVATPLANLIARNYGLHTVLGAAVLLYGLAAVSFPAYRRQKNWATSKTPSPAVL